MAAGIDGKLKALEQSAISEPAGSSLTLTQRDALGSRSWESSVLLDPVTCQVLGTKHDSGFEAVSSP